MFGILVAPARISVFATATCLLVLIASSDSFECFSRMDWSAGPPMKPLVNLKVNPPTYVVIHHSATPSCGSMIDCVQRLRNIQRDHIERKGYRDIAYNFLINGNGDAFEGQGWGKWGAHATSLNSKSVGVCFIGTFTNEAPTNKSLVQLEKLISFGVRTNKIASDYKLVAHRSVKATECPGTKLVDIIKNWPHYTTTL